MIFLKNIFHDEEITVVPKLENLLIFFNSQLFEKYLIPKQIIKENKYLNEKICKKWKFRPTNFRKMKNLIHIIM